MGRERWLVIPILLMFLWRNSNAAIDTTNRVNCHPDPEPTQSVCEARGCVWSPADQTAPVSTPPCYFPAETGFVLSSQSGSGNELNVQLQAGTPNPFDTGMSTLAFKSTMIGSTLQVTIGDDTRYVPPINLPKNPSTSTDSLFLSVGKVPNSNIFSFTVTRDSTKTVLFDTNIGAMQFADRFIQIATFLPSANLYGFGQHIHQKLRHDLSRYTIWPMFARDIPPNSEASPSVQNLYGVHPFYIVMENDGNAHGVLIVNSNAQEVETGPGPHLVYRTIGGRLDIAFFPGPKPEDVVRQYLAYVGKPFMPAYWALGYQLSRWGFRDLQDMKDAVNRTQTAMIPLDSAYTGHEYMNDAEDFTLGKGWTDFGDYAKEMHDMGMHLILIFDPAIEVDYGTFSRAMEQNVSFIEWDNFNQVPTRVQNRYPMTKGTKIMLGNVWPSNNTAFPDFLDTTNKTNDWWTSEFIQFNKQVPFDGIWIDMNEPSNFETIFHSGSRKLVSLDSLPYVTEDPLSCPIGGTDGFYDSPPYETYAVYHHNTVELEKPHLASRTLCMLGRTARGSMRFYDTKSLYGWSETRATARALPVVTGKRGVVLSRSTFPSSGRYTGTWLGDNTSRWPDLRTSMIGVMEFNFFGIPYVGSDICGFQSVTNEELCLRWHQVGAFHPLSRDHNAIHMPKQDPAVWPSVALAARIALNFRYLYLPYLYSLLYTASRYGATVIRPVFFEFPTDSQTYGLDYQFMWGLAMMIAPAHDPGVSTVHVYFPNDTWYAMMPESYGQPVAVGYSDQLAKNNSLTPVFVRGGFILPRQACNMTTTDSRKNPFELLITTGTSSTSSGELYFDNGDDIIPDNIEYHKRHHWQFNYAAYSDTGNYILTGNCEKCDASVVSPTLDTLEIFGLQDAPNFTSFMLNGVKVNIDVRASSYSALTKIATISTKSLINLNSYVSNSFTLSWTKA